jgi:Mrp family chromosome partitioning ATPase
VSDGPSLVQHYAGVLRRRRWALVVPIVVVPLLALAYSLTQANVYAAKAEVLIRAPSLPESLAGLAPEDLSDRTLTTEAHLARVPAVVQLALRHVPANGETVDGFLRDSSVTATSGTALLEFEVHAHAPRLATALATAYAEAFVDYRRGVDRQLLANARESLDARIAALRKQGGGAAIQNAQGLSARRQQLDTLAAFIATDTSLTRAADEAPQIAPRRLRTIALAVTLALVFGCGLALTWDELDRRVRAPDEIARRLGLPLLARIPPPAGDGSGSMLFGSTTPHSEALRVLRANLELAMRSRPHGTIMITSAVAGEGKSATAAHLAMAFARVGRSVVVCDLDGRRPTLAGHFGISSDDGLANVLLGRTSITAALQTVPIISGGQASRHRRRRGAEQQGRLMVLPFGATAPNADFAVSNAVSEVFAALRHRAEIVIVDTPPLLLSGESVALMNHVDGIVVVVNAESAQREMLSELRRVLAAPRATKYGVAVTGTGAESYAGYRQAEPEERSSTLPAPSGVSIAAASLPSQLGAGARDVPPRTPDSTRR